MIPKTVELPAVTKKNTTCRRCSLAENMLVTECCEQVILTFMVYSIESGRKIEHVGIRMYYNILYRYDHMTSSIS